MTKPVRTERTHCMRGTDTFRTYSKDNSEHSEVLELRDTMTFYLGKIYNSGLQWLIMATWLGISGCVFILTFIKYSVRPEFVYTYEMLGVSLCTSRGSAAVLNLNCAAIVLPMCYTLDHKIRKWARKHIPIRLSSWDGKSFHIFVGYIIAISAGIHVISHLINSYNFYKHFNEDYQDVNPLPKKDMTPFCVLTKTLAGVTGIILGLIILSLILTSCPPIRQRYFNLFWYNHRIYPLFYITLLIHGINGPIRRQLNPEDHIPGCKWNVTYNASLYDVTSCSDIPKFDSVGAEAYLWLTFPLVIYVLDFLCRVARRSETAEVTSAETIATDILEIKIRTGRKTIHPGQVIFLNCGNISTLEWHPFSVVQIPSHSNQLTSSVWIKICGDWTRGLLKTIYNEESSIMDTEKNEKIKPCTIKMDGPHSSLLEAVQQFEIAVCVAGGIGVTPFLSHIQHLAQNGGDTKVKRTIRKMYFIFVTREATHLQACFNHIKDHVEMIKRDSGDLLDVIMFYTGKDRTLQVDEFLLKKVHFQRPDLKNIFGDIHRSHKRKTIGVFCCGPDALCHSVKSRCLKETTVYTKFNFQKENF